MTMIDFVNNFIRKKRPVVVHVPLLSTLEETTG
jgi:hypothetical protein